MYDFKVIDDVVPYELRKEVYDYIQAQRWYAGYRDMPPLDRVPLEEPAKDLPVAPPHTSIYRAPFAAKPEHLSLHKPIEKLFNCINETAFDGKLKLNGLAEPSPGIYFPKRTPGTANDVKPTAKVPFAENKEQWKIDILEHGAIAYMQGTPYESVRQTRLPHRDWQGDDISSNNHNYFTLMYVANLEWKPEWLAEFTLFSDVYPEDEVSGGLMFEDLSYNRGVGIGWPAAIIDSVPGRIVMQDGRQLHATKAVGETAPELSMHVNFRVTLNN